MESDKNKEKNYDLFIDTKKGKFGMQSSKVPTCTYKFQTARGPTLKSLSKSQKPKARSNLTNNANQILSHAEKKQYLWTISQYANADEMQVILMKLWHLSHQCQD